MVGATQVRIPGSWRKQGSVSFEGLEPLAVSTFVRVPDKPGAADE